MIMTGTMTHISHSRSLRRLKMLEQMQKGEGSNAATATWIQDFGGGAPAKTPNFNHNALSENSFCYNETLLGFGTERISNYQLEFSWMESGPLAIKCLFLVQITFAGSKMYPTACIQRTTNSNVS